MAIVKGFLQMTGSIKGMSFYTRVGSDKVIMRTKGGASKYTIKHGQNFAKLRLHQLEWQGCVKFAQSMHMVSEKRIDWLILILLLYGREWGIRY